VPALEAVRPQVDEELRAFLDRERSEIASLHPDASILVEELLRLVAAGGKRLRPAFCYWGYRAAGGEDGRGIVLAAASLELLHTFALIHDDVMDRSERRRGIASTHAHLAKDHERRGLAGTPAHHGTSMAILVGDLAAVLADRMLLSSGFQPEPLAAAKRRYDAMRVEMAAGQLLDLSRGRDVDEATARRISQLKSGGYTIEGPLHIGASLAGGPLEMMTTLSRYGAPLGEAFQVRDDLRGLVESEADLVQGKPTLLLAKARELLPPEEFERLGAAGPGHMQQVLRATGVLELAAAHVNELVDRARAVLADGGLPSEARGALDELARLVAVRVDPRSSEEVPAR
jgi:geranylgeranyl diphosphate synthase type I